MSIGILTHDPRTNTLTMNVHRDKALRIMIHFGSSNTGLPEIKHIYTTFPTNRAIIVRKTYTGFQNSSKLREIKKGKNTLTEIYFIYFVKVYACLTYESEHNYMFYEGKGAKSFGG